MSFSEMWSGLSQVAAADPEHAWFSQARSAEEILLPSASNRMVGLPYTKYHCSFLDVDQAAAVVLMSVAEARRHGIPEEKWVYLLGTADALEKDTLLRPEIHRSPAAAMVGQKCFKMAGIEVEQISHIDIYSCFPSAVTIIAREMGVNHSDGSKLTTTGGIPFHGGPGANYTTHAIVAMVERLRDNPGQFGLITGNGGFLSKCSACIYSTTSYGSLHPKAETWQRENPKDYQAVLESAPDAQLAEAPVGHGLIETYTVAHSIAGPRQAIAIGTMIDALDYGKRFVAVSNDTVTLKRLVAQDALGLRVSITTNKELSSFVADAVSAKI